MSDTKTLFSLVQLPEISKIKTIIQTEKRLIAQITEENSILILKYYSGHRWCIKIRPRTVEHAIRKPCVQRSSGGCPSRECYQINCTVIKIITLSENTVNFQTHSWFFDTYCNTDPPGERKCTHGHLSIHRSVKITSVCGDVGPFGKYIICKQQHLLIPL